MKCGPLAQPECDTGRSGLDPRSSGASIEELVTCPNLRTDRNLPIYSDQIIISWKKLRYIPATFPQEKSAAFSTRFWRPEEAE